MSGIPDAWGSPLFELLVAASRRAEQFHTAYESTGQLSELDSAVALFTEVLRYAHNVDVRSAAVNGLGMSLWSRYERFGRLGDLDDAVDLFRDALAMYPDEETPAHASFHANLAGVLRLRWRRSGDEDDLVASVEESRSAVAATGPHHPRRSWRLNNLADALMALGLLHDDSSALAEAVDRIREAVAAALPDDDPVGLRSNLAEALRLRYRVTGGRERALLDEAAEQGRAAIAAAPQHPLRPRFQSNLALVLLDRFAARRRPADLAEAAALAQSAVDMTPQGHPNRTERLLILSGVRRLEATSAKSGPRPDAVRRAIQSAHDAADATPDGHHLRADALLNVGAALTLQAASGDQEALEGAFDVFRRVATDPTVQVRARVRAAWQWAFTAIGRARDGDLAAARQAFDLAVTLLPRTAPRRQAHADRERQLAALSGLARDAAAFAVGSGDVTDAVRLLEHGRGVLLGHALDVRTELTGLGESHPELAERFTALRDALDRPEGAGFSSDPVGPELSGEDRHALGAEWDRLLDEIRAQPGLTAFLRPPPADDLISASAGRGPVVVLNISALRCDALLVDAGRLRVLPLRLELTDVAYRAERFRAAVAATGEDARRTVAETLAWLWTEVAGPVLDILDPPAGSRLWWVPTGPMTTLPLHAAGPPAGPGVAERVVSSYVPTLRSLVTAWRKAPATSAAGPLVVALPVTPGMPALPSVTVETAMLTARFPDRTLVTGTHAVRRTVLDAIPRHPRVHFACHAVSAADGAADGHLVLYDHATDPLTVADIARLRLDDAELAYLSACDTGVPHPDLGDEALHVAGACHIAGFRHVIGTLWAIKDVAAATVAAGFYARFSGADDAAAALHDTVRELRTAHPDTPAQWAPYFHVGP